MRLYMGLLHYPVYNKRRQTIASAVTSMDLHDLSRLARTYGIKTFYVITPLKDQQRFAERILDHWIKGYGATYNPHRKEALELVTIASALDITVQEITAEEGEAPVLIATDASRRGAKAITYQGAMGIIASGKVVYLLFGTGWGLTQSLIDRADCLLDPIEGVSDYNHLSVRAAAAIVLDRLMRKDRGG
jgi:tRNA (guanine37-N1)-methyltransferase